MADLLSHVLIAHVVKRLSPWPGGALIFAVGTALPDVVGRIPRLVVNMLDPSGAWALPPVYINLWGVFHVPVPVVVLSAFLTFWVPREEHRLHVFANLSLGALLHLGVDFLQEHIDRGSYAIFFPFSFKGYELGWVGTEDSLDWIPWLIPVALAAEGWYRWRVRGGGARGGAGQLP